MVDLIDLNLFVKVATFEFNFNWAIAQEAVPLLASEVSEFDFQFWVPGWIMDIQFLYFQRDLH